MKKCLLIAVMMYPICTLAQSTDDPFTNDINEGYVGTGQDDPFTDRVNEGYIGSGQDDPFTEEINEGYIGTG